MSDSDKSFIYNAFRKMLTVIVKIALKNGVTHREILDLSKQVFVEVAAQDYGIGGRPTNVSRIAILTGMDRKEIKRIKDLSTSEGPDTKTERKQDRISRIISAWHQDEEYLTPKGKPCLLMRHGDERSFSTLVKRYGGDVPEVAVFKELLRIGVIKQLPSGRLKILKRTYVPDAGNRESLMRAAGVIEDLGATLIHNLYDASATGEPLRFERRAHNYRIMVSKISDFKAYLAQEGQAALERLDAWLSNNEVENTGEPCARLGVGIYMIESRSDKTEDGNVGTSGSHTK